jgi:RHS repeat-associated protein
MRKAWDTYDLAGNMLSATNGVGTATISYSYDGAMRPLTVTSSLVDSTHPGILASGISYWPHGSIKNVTYGNGLLGTTFYKDRLQPCRINLNSSSTSVSACTGSAPSGNMQDFQYGFNYGSADNGNVMTWNGSGTQTFTRSYNYDTVNRLSTLSDSTSGNPCPGLSWNYDAWGNLKAMNVTAGSCGSLSLDYNGSNQITNTGLQYDAAGNLTYDGTHHYYYDAESRIIQIDGTLGTCSSATVCYVYDANGVRVRKTWPSGSGEYVLDLNGHVVSEWGVGGGWGRGYIYLSGQILAEYGDGTTYFMNRDYLGSTRTVTNASGSVAQYMDFLPFGQQIAGNNTTAYKFTGQERGEVGLDHFGARYFTSQYGRFLTPDPMGMGAVDLTNPQSLNQYAYVGNNPLNVTDPSGMDWGDGGDFGGFGGGCSWCEGGGSGWGVPSMPGWSGTGLPGGSQGPDPASLGIYNFQNINGNIIGDENGEQLCTIFISDANCGGYMYWSSWTNKWGSDIPAPTPDQQKLQALKTAGFEAAHDLGCAGYGGLIEGGSVAASGAILSTGAKLGGATSGTSVASATARTIGVSVPKVPTPVGIPFTESFAWRSSSTLGGVLGRWFPYIGTAVSAYLFNRCVDQHP